MGSNIFLRYQIHAVPQRCDDTYMCHAVKTRECSLAERVIRVVDRPPLVCAMLGIDMVDRILHVLLARIMADGPKFVPRGHFLARMLVGAPAHCVSKTVAAQLPCQVGAAPANGFNGRKISMYIKREIGGRPALSTGRSPRDDRSMTGFGHHLIGVACDRGANRW
ncbi:hypothetical protein XI01_03505 [Bradyrhizobium sp. CCBAU 21360]|nr:hypothetical protein [Bradyrhizobium sp. CCBAU 21360]